MAAVAEVWRRGSVVASWLLDLTADALAGLPDLRFSGRVSDSGEGRWTLFARPLMSAPRPMRSAPPCSTASPRRGEADFANQLLSAMRSQFGGHAEIAATTG